MFPVRMDQVIPVRFRFVPGLVLLIANLSIAEPAAHLFKRIAIPKPFLTTENDHTFAGDIRIGDLDGDGRCDFLVYRSKHSGPAGPAIGGFKPCFLGAFDADGNILWSIGGGGTHPVRPGSITIHDLDGDHCAEVIHFWHQPTEQNPTTDWQSLSDIEIQIRDGKTGRIIRQGAPAAITERRCRDKGNNLSIGRQTANWVHQRILVANFRGTDRPRDFVVKLGDTHVAFDDELNTLWSYQTPWVNYSECPAYIPAVGDIDGDGRDEVNSGYFLLDDDGTPLWENKLGPNMDSVLITEWDNGKTRAICSGAGHVLDETGNTILSLGQETVPHGQEVRIANLRDDLPGPEMALRHLGHQPDLLVISSRDNSIISRLTLNNSPNNTGMEPVFWNGPDKAALLFNGGWLWDLQTEQGTPLPGLPKANGARIHRMGFYHAIPANFCGDDREELILWDPTATEVFIYTQELPQNVQEYSGYRAGPRQYNPRIMD